MKEVFISYKSNDPQLGNNDETVANELCAALEAAGISCWIAPRDIEPGVRYGRAIMEAINSCKVMVVVFSKHANTSEHIANEVDAIFSRKVDIIPFNIDGSQPGLELDYYLRRMQWINASGNYRQRINELIKALKLKLGKHDAGQTIIINAPTDVNTIPVNPTQLTFNVNGVYFKMIRVEGGSFIMGATPEQGEDVGSNEKPAHKETVSTFYIGETPVTELLWATVMGVDSKSLSADSFFHPVNYKGWNKCQSFIAKLNNLTGRQFRLPTEAEWEYAARGGKLSKGYKYSGSNNIDEVAWYECNSDYKVHAVALKKPNELGLYDMSGSVGEWCQDKMEGYDSVFYKNGVSYFHHRIVRGGGAFNMAWQCRVSYRGSWSDLETLMGKGLRLVL